jgi:hypothetical protein
MLQVASVTGDVPAAGRETVPAATIRPCRSEDLPAVAAIFRKQFHNRIKPNSVPIEGYLKEVFLEHPWRDEKVQSLVCVGPDQSVLGFIGVFPLRLAFDGVPLSGAISGTLMVNDPAAQPLAGARLLRAFLNGGQQISVSESANGISQIMWDKLGGATSAPYSMEWLRVFKPARFAVAVGSERTSALNLFGPLAGAFDSVAGMLKRNPLRLGTEGVGFSGADIDEAKTIDLLIGLSASYRLRPEWDRASLAWFLAQAAEKRRYGPLVRRAVRNRKGVTVGVYLYCVRPKAIAFVLQILAAPQAADAVVDDLLANAVRKGAVAIRGRTQPELADILLRRKAIFLHAASTVVHSKREDILAVIRSGEALITGLAGESWSRLIGGTFI